MSDPRDDRSFSSRVEGNAHLRLRFYAPSLALVSAGNLQNYGSVPM